jgi:hypothetical protein
MKKLSLVTVLLAFAVTSIFAQESGPKFNIGGYFMGGASLIGGENDGDLFAGANAENWVTPLVIGRLNATGETSDGVFGSYIRFDTRGVDKFLARAWWAPNSAFKLTLGNIDQGAVNNIVGWGFFANDMEDFMVAWSNPSAGGGGGWYGMTRAAAFFIGPDNASGLGLEIKPVSGLTVNVYAPIFGSETDAEKIYKHIMAQIIYDFTGIGSLSVAYTGGEGIKTDKTFDDEGDVTYIVKTADPSAVFASFNTSLLNDKLGINVGAKYTVPVDGKMGDDADIVNKKITSPVAVGLGAQYIFSDAFTLKARFASTFAGSEEVGNVTTDTPFNFGAEVCPVVNVAGLRLFFDLGVVIVKDSDEISWHFNPIVQKAIGPGSVFAGVQLKDNGETASLRWSIPVGIIVAF